MTLLKPMDVVKGKFTIQYLYQYKGKYHSCAIFLADGWTRVQ